MAFVAEYVSLRDEALEARAAQQSILQWSIGAVGLAYLAISASFSSTVGVESTAGQSQLEVFRLWVLGAGVPGFTIVAALTWMGEAIRMERAGYFLRGKERALWAHSRRRGIVPKGSFDTARDFPMMWENLIAFGLEGESVAKRRGRRKAKKQRVSTTGAMGLFFGSLFGSLVFFMGQAKAHRFADYSISLWTSVSAVVVWTVVFFYFSIRAVLRKGSPWPSILVLTAFAPIVSVLRSKRDADLTLLVGQADFVRTAWIYALAMVVFFTALFISLGRNWIRLSKNVAGFDVEEEVDRKPS